MSGEDRVNIDPSVDVEYRQYEGEVDLPLVMHLVDHELSEPYSIFTYRYFLTQWPKLCFLAFHKGRAFGVVVGKQEKHKSGTDRGYVAMLVVEHAYRGYGIGSRLVEKCIEEMVKANADEVVLEAEATNLGAIRLYERIGFVRDKRLYRYYLSGQDAFRLKLLLPAASHADGGLDLQLQAATQQMASAAI